ncbi:MAG: methyltransferase domain-containing protein [Kiloniellales bacterium]|nr:methyltransferase domain-containing protein [Kiloniellales bacterium]
MALRNLNEVYGDTPRFHARLVDLSGVKTGHRVLDLGCGAGNSLPPLLARASEVVALDVNPNFLKTASATNEAAVASGQLRVVEADAAKGLPFDDGSFDAVICQNMLECLPPESHQGLIQEVLRSLKGGGRFLLAHHDFAGTILHSRNDSLTRQLISAFSSQAQEWMASADGAIGRKLPGLLSKAGFSGLETKIEPMVALEFQNNSNAEGYCRDLASAGAKAGVAAKELEDWHRDLLTLDGEDAFFLAIPWIYVLARK